MSSHNNYFSFNNKLLQQPLNLAKKGLQTSLLALLMASLTTFPVVTPVYADNEANNLRDYSKEELDEDAAAESLANSVAGQNEQADTQALSGFNPQAYFPQAQLSLYAINLATNQVILSHNSEKMMKPASTLKVITALNAATTFNWDHSFTTRAYAYGSLNNGNLNGDLVVEFVGDPSFTLANLNNLAQQITSRVKSVSGKLIINVGRYSGHDRPIGWNWANNSACYSSENSAATLGYNCIQVTLKNEKTGTIANVVNTNPVITARSQVAVVSSDRARFCDLNYTSDNRLSINLVGCASPRKGGIWMNLAVPNGNQYTAAMVANRLNAYGLKVGSPVLDTNYFLNGYNDKPLQEVAAVSGANMAQLVTRMLHSSENHIAEHLYRNTAHELLQTSINYALAKDVNTQKMALYGINGTYQIEDGSGLSYSDNISARDMTRVMAYIYRNDSTLNLLSKFPSQKQGTLASHRPMQNYSILGKTGSIAGAYNFTGIIFNRNNQPVAFTYFVNNYINSGGRVQRERLETDLLRALYNN